LTNEKVIRGKQTLTQIVYDAGRPPARTDSPIYKLCVCSNITLHIKYSLLAYCVFKV